MITNRIKIKNQATTAFKANGLMNNLFDTLTGVEGMTNKERADLLRQVATLAENWANEVEEMPENK
jgi:hypothetical protein